MTGDGPLWIAAEPSAANFGSSVVVHLFVIPDLLDR